MCACVVCVPDVELNRSGEGGVVAEVLIGSDMLCVAYSKRVQGVDLSRVASARRTITRADLSFQHT